LRKRRIILVSGAPRSGTTPVGNLLSRCQSAVSIYEPLGTTGLARVKTRFPVIGETFSQAELEELIDDLAAFRFGRLKPQARRAGPVSLFTKLFGSRTLHSIRLARLQPWSRTIIWKDPHAILLVPDLVEAGVDTVITVRTPQAHAASYKRLGWHSQAAEIYPRWSARFGRCTICESFLERTPDGVQSAALLWRMSYLPLVRTGSLERVHLITSADLETDERATYGKLIEALALTPTRGVERMLSKPRREAAVADMASKAHDWTRSVSSVNNYWREVLTEDDIAEVDRITSDLTPRLFAEPRDRIHPAG